MGYEIKIFMGDDSGSGAAPGEASYFMVAAMVDICKPGYDSAIYDLIKSDLAKVRSAKPIYLYDLDGNIKFKSDCYDSDLISIPATLVRRALRKDAGHSNGRRFRFALDTLNSFIRGWKKSARCVLYGH